MALGFGVRGGRGATQSAAGARVAGSMATRARATGSLVAHVSSLGSMAAPLMADLCNSSKLSLIYVILAKLTVLSDFLFSESPIYNVKCVKVCCKL